MTKPALSDAEILERLPIHLSEETSAEERGEHAAFLADYCRSSVAEDAVCKIVDTLPSGVLNELLRVHLFKSPLATDYCRYPKTIAQRLKTLRFSPILESADGWTLGWSGGEEMRGEQLCQLALKVFWLRKMRETPPIESTPSY